MKVDQRSIYAPIEFLPIYRMYRNIQYLKIFLKLYRILFELLLFFSFELINIISNDVNTTNEYVFKPAYLTEYKHCYAGLNTYSSRIIGRSNKQTLDNRPIKNRRLKIMRSTSRRIFF